VLGVELEDALNRSTSNDARAIHSEGAPVAVLVVPTNEELEIAEQTLRCIQPG
jgi:acetate kinase